jgi:hypothetical protein
MVFAPHYDQIANALKYTPLRPSASTVFTKIEARLGTLAPPKNLKELENLMELLRMMSELGGRIQAELGAPESIMGQTLEFQNAYRDIREVVLMLREGSRENQKLAFTSLKTILRCRRAEDRNYPTYKARVEMN